MKVIKSFKKKYVASYDDVLHVKFVVIPNKKNDIRTKPNENDPN